MPIFVKVAADASKFVPEGITIVLPDSPKVIEDPVDEIILSTFNSVIIETYILL